ncbi:flagellar motor protein MotA [Varunaivibrio sulfuroxidans]|uniref:MotA/TolQ/ExbB proton channel family protein n=1 Tax=Varunaivibrio sulfuroxidans TaxID=1773489 RepID=A0A4R3JAU8_9PROT|nr:flagellar motor protein MotA [Varunaivibrio sulfuroxidans]TCS63129.1 hypothetical protein EDD55_104222 [Varunaivibrio sulfuroxidans]WES31801.1 flagellar motor protein MotA [Varunaivibrio sulfuroxidans]
MSRPRLYFIRMIMFLMVVAVAAAVLYVPLKSAFMGNPPLNGMIVGVFILGAVYNFRQVFSIVPEIEWIENFRTNQSSVSSQTPPRLLAPMATMLGEKRDSISLSTLSMRSLLDGIASRLEETRDIARYTIGLLIFLGLLGTFWGLLSTVGAIRDVIAGLNVGGGDVTRVFADLKSGLEAPLTGMGTAFSSSLFGLAGSLILGFLDLQAGQAQNRFYTELEDWLSSLTRLSSGSLSIEGDQSVPAYVQALLEQSADSLDNLQRTLARGEENRISANTHLIQLTDKLGVLNDFMQTEQMLMKKMAENQIELKAILTKIVDRSTSDEATMDGATRAHIRNLDVYVARLLEEIGNGRSELVEQLRSEFRLLARTIAARSNE